MFRWHDDLLQVTRHVPGEITETLILAHLGHNHSKLPMMRAREV